MGFGPRGSPPCNDPRSWVFFVLQYIPASDEGSLDEEEEEDFYEDANREGDDEGEKNKNWEVNGVHCLGIFRPNVVGVDLLQTNGQLCFSWAQGLHTNCPRFW